MEREMLCANSDNALVKKFSEALVKQGVTEGAQYYYTDDDFHLPFFKIPKAYKKESPTDPDVHFVFVDIDSNPPVLAKEEYTVHGNYVHEHIADADKAAELVVQLIKAEMVEVAIVYPDRMAGFFVGNTGDPEKNVGIIAENFETIKGYLENDMAAMNGGHMHTLFPKIFPKYLQYGPTTKHRIPGINIYLVSSVLAEHPEFYIIQ